MTPADRKKALETFKALKAFPPGSWVYVPHPVKTALDFDQPHWFLVNNRPCAANPIPEHYDVVWVEPPSPGNDGWPSSFWICLDCITDWKPAEE